MKIIRRVADLKTWRAELAETQPALKLAFVPTMGYLHAGHLSLLSEARRRVPRSSGLSVLSIFVNPTQFGPNEDLASYPRDEARDLALAEAEGVDVVYAPEDVDDFYPLGPRAWVELPEMSTQLCGAGRPGHFRGVCSVVTRLWNLVRPDLSLFGMKDYQQLAILKRLHAELMFPGEVVGMPIVRERDGLAMSSRNIRLAPSQRQQALALSRCLDEVEAAYARGARTRAELLDAPASRLSSEVDRLEYAELVDAAALQPFQDQGKLPVLCALAAHVGSVRLIDNRVLGGA